MPIGSSTDRFVTAVFRRLLIVRAIEHLVAGMLIGCSAAVVLLPLAQWQNQPVGPVLIFATGVAILIAGFGFYARRPSRLQAMMLADSQLRFGELLITALSPVGHGDSDFHRAILAQANAACERHEPSEVLLRRMGVRSWSALGLVLSMTVVLASIPLRPARSSAVDVNSAVLMSDADQSALHSSSGATTVVNDPNSSGASSDAMSSSVDSIPEKPSESAPGAGQSQSTAGGGGGSAGSISNSTVDHRHDQSSGRTPTNDGSIAGGGAAGAGGESGATRAGGSTVGSRGDHRQLPGWSGTGDPAAGGSALQDRTPAEDRELIRDFFAR
jgi:hypothetical protein